MAASYDDNSWPDAVISGTNTDTDIHKNLPQIDSTASWIWTSNHRSPLTDSPVFCRGYLGRYTVFKLTLLQPITKLRGVPPCCFNCHFSRFPMVMSLCLPLSLFSIITPNVNSFSQQCGASCLNARTSDSEHIFRVKLHSQNLSSWLIFETQILCVSYIRFYQEFVCKMAVVAILEFREIDAISKLVNTWPPSWTVLFTAQQRCEFFNSLHTSSSWRVFRSIITTCLLSV